MTGMCLGVVLLILLFLWIIEILKREAIILKALILRITWIFQLEAY